MQGFDIQLPFHELFSSVQGPEQKGTCQNDNRLLQLSDAELLIVSIPDPLPDDPNLRISWLFQTKFCTIDPNALQSRLHPEKQTGVHHL